MVVHSGILAWRIPWTQKLGGLQSTGSQRVGYHENSLRHTHTPHKHTHTPHTTKTHTQITQHTHRSHTPRTHTPHTHTDLTHTTHTPHTPIKLNIKQRKGFSINSNLVSSFYGLIFLYFCRVDFCKDFCRYHPFAAPLLPTPTPTGMDQGGLNWRGFLVTVTA